MRLRTQEVTVRRQYGPAGEDTQSVYQVSYLPLFTERVTSNQGIKEWKINPRMKTIIIKKKGEENHSSDIAAYPSPPPKKGHERR